MATTDEGDAQTDWVRAYTAREIAAALNAARP
jgi:hypothetical protein